MIAFQDHINAYHLNNIIIHHILGKNVEHESTLFLYSPRYDTIYGEMKINLGT